FDCAAQGRIDAFFLSGGQIDGAGNINLVGLGDYPNNKVRFPGSFGSAYLYMLVPRVILFREEHTPRVMVEAVDFISAAGSSPQGVYRPGGPHALVTGLCVFAFDRDAGGFRLASVHPGVSVAQVREATGFSFVVEGRDEDVPQTALPDAATLATLRGDVARDVARTYPAFAAKVFDIPPTAD
ncbi:MAG: CoA-transferase, partial [Pseudomonadota bacterium]